MPSVTSYEVAQLRTAFHNLHTDVKVHDRSPTSSQESMASTISDFDFDFEKNEEKLTDLLGRVQAKEIEVMDTITLKNLAAMQTHEYDQYMSLFQSKKDELRQFSIHLEPKIVSQSVDNSKFARSRPSRPAHAPTTPLKRKRANSTVTPLKSQQLSVPVTPKNNIMSQDHMLSASIVLASTPLVPTITITPPRKTPPSCHAPQPLSSSPKKLPVLRTWSTRSPKKPESKPPAATQLEPAVEFVPNAIHSSPKRTHKSATKSLANSPVKRVKPEHKSKVVKTSKAPTRRNPQRNPHSIARKIANANIHTLRLPENFETIDGAEYNDAFTFFTSPGTITTPPLIWNQRYGEKMSAFPDLPPGMSARALGHTLAGHMSNTLNVLVQKYPDLEDLETAATTMKSQIYHVMERIAMVAERTAVVVDGNMPVTAPKNPKAASTERLGSNPAREDAKDSKINYLQGRIKALNEEITYFRREEKRYGAILDDNEQLKEENATLKVLIEESSKVVSTDVEGELRDTRMQLEAALRNNARMHNKVRGLERGTGKSIDEMLIKMQVALEKNANADIDDGHYNYEEDDDEDLVEEGFEYGFAAPASKKQKVASV